MEGFLKNHRQIVNWTIILTGAMLLAGCASPAKKVCLQTNWQQLGYLDGSIGKLPKNSASQREQCMQEGVAPDMTKYELGRREGLNKYCNADNGLALGEKGETYLGVCPPELAGPFTKAYHRGLRSHAKQLKKDITDYTLKQSELRQALEEVEKDMDYLKNEIKSVGLGRERIRMGMISEMRMLERDQQSFRLQAEALGMDIADMRKRMIQIKEQTGSN